MKSYIKRIIGKTIINVVVAERTREPKYQVYLVFSDGTHFELYGATITCANHIEQGNVENVIELLNRNEREKFTVYPESEMSGSLHEGIEEEGV